jgi:phosphoribosylformimino-5-aminoimidazole carboxamide ribotide isomerase
MDREVLLSLDFRGDAFLGPARLLASAGTWPHRVIVMTLARVGTGGGPDFTRLDEIIGRAGPSRQVYAAGGVRNMDDLKRLRDLGVAGALVATALHTGQIKTGDLEEIAGSSSQSTSAEWLP